MTAQKYLSAVSWKDNKQIILCTYYVGAVPVRTIKRYDKTVKIRAPIQNCSKLKRRTCISYMGVVDLTDSFLGRYHLNLKSRKWYLHIFCRLSDITITNVWVLYQKVGQQKDVNSKNLLILLKYDTLQQLQRQRKGASLPTIPTQKSASMQTPT